MDVKIESSKNQLHRYRELHRYAIMDNELLAYFITWTCYGTYLPGDERGWVKWHSGYQPPQPMLYDWCKERMLELPVFLSQLQRTIVNEVVREHCEIRNWLLHEVNCRTNHCHVIVTATGYSGELVRDQLKTWTKRRLKDHQRTCDPDIVPRERWWTKKESVQKIFDEESLRQAIAYVRDAQDLGGSKA